MFIIIGIAEILKKVAFVIGMFYGEESRVSFLTSCEKPLDFLISCVWVINHLPESFKILYNLVLHYFGPFIVFITFYLNILLGYFFNLFLIKKIFIIYSTVIAYIEGSIIFLEISIFLDFSIRYLEELAMDLITYSLAIAFFGAFYFFFFFILFIFLFSLLRLVPYKKKKKYFENTLKYFKIGEPFNTPSGFYFPILKYKKYLKIKAKLTKLEIGEDDFKIYTLKKSDLIKDLSFTVGDPFATSLVVHTKARQLSFKDKICAVQMVIILLFLFLFPIVSILFYIFNFLDMFELAGIACLYGGVFIKFIPHFKTPYHVIESYEYVSGKQDSTVLKFRSTYYSNDFTTTFYIMSLNLNKKFVCLIYWLIDVLSDYYYICLLFFYFIGSFFLFSVFLWLSFSTKLAWPLVLCSCSFYFFFSYYFLENKHTSKKSILLYIILYVYLCIFIWFLFAIKFAIHFFFVILLFIFLFT